MTPLAGWLAERTAGAPEALRERVVAWSGMVEDGGSSAMTLGQAGVAALDAAIEQGGDRAVALDLLAADALVTLALLAAAEDDPGHLGEFAQRLRLEGAARA